MNKQKIIDVLKGALAEIDATGQAEGVFFGDDKQIDEKVRQTINELESSDKIRPVIKILLDGYYVAILEPLHILLLSAYQSHTGSNPIGLKPGKKIELEVESASNIYRWDCGLTPDWGDSDE